MSLKKLALAALGLALLILLCLGPGRRSTNVRPPTKPSVLPKAAVMATRSSGANSGPLARRSLAAVQTPGSHIELAYPPKTSVSDPQFAAFNEWAVEYLNTAPAQKTALADRGVELARKRRNKMVDLIQSHPDQAIAWTFPRVQRFDLPQEVQAQLEQPVSA